MDVKKFIFNWAEEKITDFLVRLAVVDDCVPHCRPSTMAWLFSSDIVRLSRDAGYVSDSCMMRCMDAAISVFKLTGEVGIDTGKQYYEVTLDTYYRSLAVTTAVAALGAFYIYRHVKGQNI